MEHMYTTSPNTNQQNAFFGWAVIPPGVISGMFEQCGSLQVGILQN